MDAKQMIIHFLANNLGWVLIGILAILLFLYSPKFGGLVIGMVVLWLVTRLMGPGTVIERAQEQTKLDTKYQQCLANAASQLGPQVQPKVSTCARMTGRAKELCLENVLSTDGADEGGLNLVRSCVEKWQVIGSMRSSTKPFAQPLCVGERFQPEFLKKILCKPDGPSNQP